jgi:hypothetical protein
MQNTPLPCCLDNVELNSDIEPPSRRFPGKLVQNATNLVLRIKKNYLVDSNCSEQ